MSKTQGRQHQRSSGVHGPQLFCVAKRKRGNKGKKEQSFKEETIERLSLRSKYYYFRHSRASKIEKSFFLVNYGGRKYFSVFHAPLNFEIYFASPVLDFMGT